MKSRIYIPSQDQRKGVIWINRIGLMDEVEPAMIKRADCHDFFLSFFHTSAEIKDLSGLKKYPPDSLICWKPGDSHNYGNTSENWCNSWIHFEGPNARILVDHFYNNKVIHIQNPDIANSAFNSIFEEVSANYYPDAVIINNILEILFRTIQREINKLSENVAELKNIPEKLLEIKSYLTDHYYESIQITELAKMFYTSSSSLNKNFRTYFGCSPVDYLINIRMEQAKYFLQDENLKINDIAKKIGFADISFFSKTIKKHFGISPAELRKKMQSEKPKNQYIQFSDYNIS